MPFGRLVKQEVDLQRLRTNETVQKMRWYVDGERQDPKFMLDARTVRDLRWVRYSFFFFLSLRSP